MQWARALRLAANLKPGVHRMQSRQLGTGLLGAALAVLPLAATITKSGRRHRDGERRTDGAVLWVALPQMLNGLDSTVLPGTVIIALGLASGLLLAMLRPFDPAPLQTLASVVATSVVAFRSTAQRCVALKADAIFLFITPKPKPSKRP